MRPISSPATRRYLLAGLLVCGVCGRRLESAWSNGKPAYRCRHGYTSATSPNPTRPKNTYIREDTILPRLAALAILHHDSGHQPPSSKQVSRQITAPAQAADQIEQLRATGITLIYDPATKTLRTGAGERHPCRRRLTPAARKAERRGKPQTRTPATAKAKPG